MWLSWSFSGKNNSIKFTVENWKTYKKVIASRRRSLTFPTALEILNVSITKWSNLCLSRQRSDHIRNSANTLYYPCLFKEETWGVAQLPWTPPPTHTLKGRRRIPVIKRRLVLPHTPCEGQKTFRAASYFQDRTRDRNEKWRKRKWPKQQVIR